MMAALAAQGIFIANYLRALLYYGSMAEIKQVFALWGALGVVGMVSTYFAKDAYVAAGVSIEQEMVTQGVLLAAVTYASKSIN